MEGKPVASREPAALTFRSAPRKPVVLINLAEDRGELTDCSRAYPEKVRSLQAMWDAWNKEMKPAAW